MSAKESSCNSTYCEQMHRAERELSAFIAAVTELFGAEQATLSAEDWLAELELMDNPTRSTNRGWCTLTIAASARLTSRLNVAIHRQIIHDRSTTDTKVSSIPSSSCFSPRLLL